MTSIRRAVAADGPSMRALARDAYSIYVERIGRPPAPMEADYVAVINDSESWVVEDDSGLVGMLVLRPASDHILLDNLAVRTDRQGEGVGSILLAKSEERARDLALPEVRLYTNVKMTENIDYYERHGYVLTHVGSSDGFRRAYFTLHLRLKSGEL
jgi:N-acetylglutamate synthase-like GNAT family acetyltransferase